MKTQTYAEFVSVNFRTTAERKLTFKVGDTVAFKTQTGNYPGRWTGRITKRLIDSPWGPLSHGWEHYWRTGDDSQILVRYEIESYTPAMFRVFNKMTVSGEKSLILPAEMVEGKIFD